MIIHQKKYTEEIKKFVNAYALDGDHLLLEPYFDIISMKYETFIQYDDMLGDVEIWFDKTQIYRSAYSRYGWANYTMVPNDVFVFDTIDSLIDFLWKEMILP